MNDCVSNVMSLASTPNMASDSSLTPGGSQGRGLPPVTPPSGRFIAQLFLVPGLIVFFVVLLVLAINYMFVGGQSPDQFLVRIDSDNADIRWRGANDLAQTLKRKESVHLRTNVGFALDLCERLDKAMKSLREEEKTLTASMPKDADPTKAFRKLDPQRNLVLFLASSLGDFPFAAGVPQLSELVVEDPGADVVNGALRRRRALWSLANLGDNVKKFATQLKPEQQNLVLATLRTEAQSENVVRRKAAKNALFYLNEFPDLKDADIVAVDQTLDVASRADDQYLREMTALSLNFWDGPLAVATLIRLSRDDGFGTMVRTPEEP